MRGQIEEDVQRLLVGVIILLVGVLLFSRIITKPACDDMAKASAESMVDAINKAATDPAFEFGEKEPSLKADGGKYAPAVIRLCQSATASQSLAMQMFGGIPYLRDAVAQGEASLGPLPQYQLYWKEAPGADAPWYAMWTESYPWSSQALGQLVFYGSIKYGPKAVWKIGGVMRKAVGGVIVRGLVRAANLAARTANKVAKMVNLDSVSAKLSEKNIESAYRASARRNFFRIGVLDIARKEGGTEGISRFVKDIRQFRTSAGLWYEYGVKKGYSSKEFKKIWKAWHWQKMYNGIGIKNLESLVDDGFRSELKALEKEFMRCPAGACELVGNKYLLKTAPARKAFRQWLDNQPPAVRALAEGTWAAPHVTDNKYIQKIWKGVKRLQNWKVFGKYRENVRATWRLWRAGVTAEGGNIENNMLRRESAVRAILETRIGYLENPTKYKQVLAKIDSKHPFKVALRKFAKGNVDSVTGLPSDEVLTRFFASKEGVVGLNNWLLVMPNSMELRQLREMAIDMPFGKLTGPEGDTLGLKVIRGSFDSFEAENPQIVEKWYMRLGLAPEVEDDVVKMKSYYRALQASLKDAALEDARIKGYGITAVPYNIDR
jgi:hypothetical protein